MYVFIKLISTKTIQTLSNMPKNAILKDKQIGSKLSKVHLDTCYTLNVNCGSTRNVVRGFKLGLNHTGNVWQILTLSCSIKDLMCLGFKCGYNLYDDPVQRCSVVLLLQLRLLLYSG